MVTVHLFHAPDEDGIEGSLEVVVVDGTHREARDLCWERLNDPEGDVYRAGTYDTLSQRYTFDSDHAWYRPVAA